VAFSQSNAAATWTQLLVGIPFLHAREAKELFSAIYPPCPEHFREASPYSFVSMRQLSEGHSAVFDEERVPVEIGDDEPIDKRRQRWGQPQFPAHFRWGTQAEQVSNEFVMRARNSAPKFAGCRQGRWKSRRDAQLNLVLVLNLLMIGTSDSEMQRPRNDEISAARRHDPQAIVPL
jgi:hypothetical protein